MKSTELKVVIQQHDVIVDDRENNKSCGMFVRNSLSNICALRWIDESQHSTEAVVAGWKI